MTTVGDVPTTNSDPAGAVLLTSASSSAPSVLRAELVEPFISDRAKFPARHSVVDGISPWSLGIGAEVQDDVVSFKWSIVAFDRSRPVGDGGVVATETAMVVEVVAVGRDGTSTGMGTCDCVLRTELDDRSLADRQLTGQGWLLPLGYTVVVDASIA